MPALSGRTALVTGASRGIGAAIARRLARDGASVIVHYGRSEAEAEALAAEIGGRAVQADLEQPDGYARLADSVEGTLHVLVNNAGVFKGTTLGKLGADSMDWHYAVNLRSPVLLTQALLPKLADPARVVFLSSVVAGRSMGQGGVIAYAATKGAIESVVIHLADALGPRNITVNAVAPGLIDTAMTDWAGDPQSKLAAACEVQALKRVGQPADVADVVAFLAGDDGRWVTGMTIQVGGGTRL